MPVARVANDETRANECFQILGFVIAMICWKLPVLFFSVKTLHQFRNFALFGEIYDRIELFDGIIAVVQGHRHCRFEAELIISLFPNSRLGTTWPRMEVETC